MDLEALGFVAALLEDDGAAIARRAHTLGEERLIPFLERQQLAGAAYVVLERLGGTPTFPWPLVRGLKIRYLEQWRWNQKIRAALVDVARALDEAGIGFVYLKGFHLAQSFYGDADARRIGDVDLLVRATDRRRALAALERIGFRRKADTTRVDGWLARVSHHLELERRDVPLDLHHALRVYPGVVHAEEEIWAGVAPADLGGPVLPVLSAEHALLMTLLTIHDDVAKATIHLRAFVDFARVARAVDAEIDWTAFLERRRRDGTRSICLNAAALGIVLLRADRVAPRLAAEAARLEAELVLPMRLSAALSLIEGAGALERKRWAFRQYPVPLARTVAWWLAGLPAFAVTNRKAVGRDLAGAIARPWSRSAPRAAGGGLGPADFGAEAPGAVTGTYRFGSLTARFAAGRALHREIVEELFRLELEPASDSPDLELSIVDVESSARHRPSWRPSEPIVRRRLERITEIHHRDATAWIDESGPRPRLLVTVVSRDRPREHVLHCVMVVLYKALFRLGAVHLHAAAVRRGREAVLLVGEKGAGKSTLCLRLGRDGATVLAEDHVVVRRRGEGFVASGCDAKMRLTEKTERYFFAAPLAVEAVDQGGVLKKQIEMTAHLPCAPFEDAPIRRIFFPRVGEVLRARPLGGGEAFRRVLASIRDRHYLGGLEDAREMLGFFAGLLDSAELHELELSPDLDDLGRAHELVFG